MTRLLVPEIVPTEANAKELLALLDRLIRSPQFLRAPRLQELLVYIGRQSIVEGRRDLHEQEIGCSVFGRRPDYDTSHDNIVRVNATEVRKRLESYFATDGIEEPWVLEVPRGGYSPVFTRRVSLLPTTDGDRQSEHVATSASVVPDLSISVQTNLNSTQPPDRGRLSPRTLRGIILALAGIVIIVCIFCCLLLLKDRRLRQQMHVWQATPTLRSFWGNFLAGNRETDIILADTSFALEEDVLKTSIPLSDYLNYAYKGLPQGISPDTRSALEAILSRNNGSISDFRAARRILMLDPLSSSMRLRFARDYTPDFLKHNNVILIGSRKSNPWVDLFQDQLEFVIGYDASLYQIGVRNLHPQSGEPQFYPEPQDPSTNVGYGIIAFLPNVGQEGDALLIEGIDSQATEAAGEFVTNEDSMASLKHRMNVDKLPYFQLLLKTSRLSGTPFTAQVLAVRTYPGRNR
jgi:hypothetical protein